ncbi:hypothetical protein BU17DRAFT_61892 [Hysterangium stoloniferum]|nr:hypothetical protein BU17DRAFT_61892 [Hysterangium stoloniferum]
MSRFWPCPNGIARTCTYLGKAHPTTSRHIIPGIGLGWRRYSSETAYKWAEPEGWTPKQIVKTHFIKIAFTLDAREILEPFVSLLQHIAPEVGFDPSLVVPRLDPEFKLQHVILTEFATTPEMEENSITVELLDEVVSSLKEPIRALRGGETGPINIPFGALRPIMHVRRREYNPHSTLVLCLQPAAGPANDMLHDITGDFQNPIYICSCHSHVVIPSPPDLIHARFLRKGIISDNGRRFFPPSLTMSVIRGKTAVAGVVKETTFDLVKLYNHPALDIYRKPKAPTPLEEHIHQMPLELDLGSVQLQGLVLEKMIRKGEMRPNPAWHWPF